MVPPVLLETLIENALLAAVASGTFYAVSYASGQSGAATLADVSTAPVSFGASPVSAAFGEDLNNRMALQHGRLDWKWAVEAQWDRRVALEHFERAILKTPIIIPRATSSGIYQSAELRLVSARYGQPARDEVLKTSRIFTYTRGNTGTYALWTFVALLTSDRSP